MVEDEDDEVLDVVLLEDEDDEDEDVEVEELEIAEEDSEDG